MATTSQAADAAVVPAGGKGMGAAVAAVGKVFTVGDMKKTDAPLDLAVSGQGFFEILMPDGSLAYTRNGAFQLNADGALVTRDGYALNASIQVPADTMSIQVGANGRVLATVAGENSAG
ncbi:MAG: flagellar hook-basal body complex protein [Chromatiales bacterium]|nr:flagellar hook-basal body complex protein [Chromatiales bacterium]